MVIADSWSEQRVLMRAFAASEDQTRPMIVLHGVELAIGPAGTDPHGQWGIHVEPPADGRAQELRDQLELAARRLAGSKGNPPRLVDEEPAFDRKPTNQWAPGTPPDRSMSGGAGSHDRPRPYEPAEVARPVNSPVIPSAAPRRVGSDTRPPSSSPSARSTAPKSGRSVPNPASPNALRSSPGLPGAESSVDIIPAADRKTMFASDPSVPVGTPPPPAPGFAAAHAIAAGPVSPPQDSSASASLPAKRRRGWTNPAARTTPGFAPMGSPIRSANDRGSPIRSANDRGAPVPRVPSQGSASREPNLANLVGVTMPLGFRLSDPERDVLNALGKGGPLTASKIMEIAKVQNVIEWMDELMTKLSSQGLDLIVPGDDVDGEPTYLLRR